MHYFFLLISIFITFSLNCFTLKESITKASAGDYIVFQQGGNYTLLTIRSISFKYLILEEIVVPAILRNTKTISWKNWVEQNAPGHTSWISLLIELENNKIIESYSHTKNSWLSLRDYTHFFIQLLTLPMEKTPENERQKIGTPPIKNKSDHRALWYPTVILENKKMENIPTTAWTSTFPKDPPTPLSGYKIEFYFSSFPFPHWVEIKSPNYKISLQAIDGGRQMKSPKPLVLQKSLTFIGSHRLINEERVFLLQAPNYYSPIQIFAIDTSENPHKVILITEINENSEQEITIKLSKEFLKSQMQKNHIYNILAVSKEFPLVVANSQPFTP
jgi:hypothetical protein